MLNQLLKNKLSLLNIEKGYTKENIEKIILSVKNKIIEDCENEFDLDTCFKILEILDKNIDIG